ncbi:helix-turn-helix transcriptional regulator [Sporomusa aerivorans]|uniref:helix-turn-helix transcriptional regulator n=1 Tax=Sporomusa aerivorans TaxID=204936 RepID=UPI00352A16AF
MNTALGRRIRSLRESKGITQEQVAEQMACTRQKYARLEKGLIDISYSSLNIIAGILGVKIEDITSSVNNVPAVQPIFRGENGQPQEDKFAFITNMIETFYAHRKLYNSVKLVDADE